MITIKCALSLALLTALPCGGVEEADYRSPMPNPNSGVLFSLLPIDTKIHVEWEKEHLVLDLTTPSRFSPFWAGRDRRSGWIYSTSLPSLSLIANIGQADEKRNTLIPDNIHGKTERPASVPIHSGGKPAGKVVLFSATGEINTHRAVYRIRKDAVSDLGDDFVVVPGSPFAKSVTRNADSPSATLSAYYTALKGGDLEAAKGLTASFEKLPAHYVDQLTSKYSDGAKSGKLRLKVIPGSSKILEDCAVVTFADGDKEKPDYDPAFLLKQDDRWRVFLKLTDWEHPAFELAEPQRERFRKLGEWFGAEKERLSK